MAFYHSKYIYQYSIYNMKKKKKKYLNSKQKNKSLAHYLERQTYLKKLNSKTNEIKEQITTPYLVQQQFSLPLYGKHAYFYGLILKYFFLLTIFSLLFIFTILILFEALLKLDGNQIIAHYWWILLLSPAILLIVFVPLTKYQKQLIQNYIITDDALHIVYTDKSIKVIDYQDIYSASSQYGGTSVLFFRISYYCQTTQKMMKDFPLFDEIISFFNVYPIKNDHELIASFLQQLIIHNPKISIHDINLYFYYISPETLELNLSKLSKERSLWWFFWIISILLALYFIFIKSS